MPPPEEEEEQHQQPSPPPSSSPKQQQQQEQRQRQRPYTPSEDEILSCQLSSWYPAFRSLGGRSHDEDDRRTNVTIKSITIFNIPDSFVQYLLSDGIRLPDGTRTSGFLAEDTDRDDWSSESDSSSPKQRRTVGNNENENENDDDDEDHDDDSDCNEEDDEDIQAPLIVNFSFPELTEQIANAIKELGGSVIPKLNWSAPRDAVWINHHHGNSMRCETPGDVYLLLKSSDFIMHDVLKILENSNDDSNSNSNNNQNKCTDLIGTSSKTREESTSENGIDGENDGEGSHPDEIPENSKGIPSSKFTRFELTLRKWCNLHPSMEFRCFIWQHQLLALTQRNHTQHFPHLKTDRWMIRDLISDFFEGVVQHRFGDRSSSSPPPPSSEQQQQQKQQQQQQQQNGSTTTRTTTMDISNYVLDVYVDQRDRVWIVDFNVWGLQTDPLLFEWTELQALATEATTERPDDHDRNDTDHHSMPTQELPPLPVPPEMRIVEHENEIRSDPLASYRAPIDTLEIAAATAGGDHAALQAFFRDSEIWQRSPNPDRESEA